MKSSTLQSAFNGGELDPQLFERFELKYFSTGCSYAENVEIIPQGGFRIRDGLRTIGALNSGAARIFPFKASDGSGYDLVFYVGNFAVWDETSQLDTAAVSGLTADMLPELTVAQQLDTMLLFHRDLRTKRIKILAADDWTVGNAPYEEIPDYDFGADIDGDPYTNAVAAEWQVEFVGLLEEDDTETDDIEPQSVFTLTVSGQETTAIGYLEDMGDLADAVEAAILELPNIGSGLTVAAGTGKKIVITFGGTDNVGDGWVVSGKVINKADAAILTVKKTVGVAPGEAIMSTDRGWPQCGCFYGQRLLVGGFKALPNAWMFSTLADYFNFDQRFTGDDGPQIIPMDAAGGEAIEHMVSSRNLTIHTSEAEYWIAERALSRNAAPAHVQSSTNGTKRGVPVVKNENASIYCHANGGVLGEFIFTDVQGSFVSTDLSLLASHLLTNVQDLALKKATVSRDGNRLIVVLEGGNARMVTLLREQEITAFARLTSPGATFIAGAVNPRNDVSLIVARPDGRRLERMEDGLLLDDAIDKSFASSTIVTGLGRYTGREIWAIAGGDVHGPFTPAGTTITLPYEVSGATVGVWNPPVITTLPISPEAAPGQVVKKRKGRIFTVWISLVDTTSIAVSANGGALKEVDLVKWGADADVSELSRSFTGTIKVENLLGWVDEPTVTVSQLRPGRLTVRSITVEAVR